VRINRQRSKLANVLAVFILMVVMIGTITGCAALDDFFKTA